MKSTPINYMPRLVSLCVLTLIIIFLGITFFRVVAPFLLPLFLAGVVAMLVQPIYRYFVRRTNERPRIAAGLTTVAVILMILIPLLVGTFIGSVQLYTLTEKLDEGQLSSAISKFRSAAKERILAEKESLFEVLQPILPLENSEEDPETIESDPKKQTELQKARFEDSWDDFLEKGRLQLKSIAARSLGMAGKETFGLLGSAVSAFIGILMFTIGLYYFLADGPKLIAAAESIIPMHAEHQRQMLHQFDRVVRSVVLATFLAAIAQGLATAIVLYIVGFHHFFIIFLVATLASLIPLTGTWLIWGPCAIWLGIQGYWPSCIFLVIIGAGVIGLMDNVIRTYVLSNDTKLHPLLAFVSVLGGLHVMGLWGVFIGPTVACCLHALIKIFNTELQDFSRVRQADLVLQTEDSGNIDVSTSPISALTITTEDAMTPGEQQADDAATNQDQEITEPSQNSSDPDNQHEVDKTETSS